jgi:phosphonate C-P lyase system protein PhnG
MDRSIETEIDRDYALCECALEPLAKLVEQLERSCDIQLVKIPTPCLVMIRAADSIEGQEFYLGEALASECEVSVDESTGYGICLGEEPERAYALAIIDALYAADTVPRTVEQFVATQCALLRHHEQVEFNQIMRSQVDFKLFDEE